MPDPRIAESGRNRAALRRGLNHLRTGRLAGVSLREVNTANFGKAIVAAQVRHTGTEIEALGAVAKDDGTTVVELHRQVVVPAFRGKRHSCDGDSGCLILEVSRSGEVTGLAEPLRSIGQEAGITLAARLLERLASGPSDRSIDLLSNSADPAIQRAASLTGSPSATKPGLFQDEALRIAVRETLTHSFDVDAGPGGGGGGIGKGL